MGDFLGDMSNQYPKHRIVAYYSSGCKAYALKMINLKTGREEYVVKSKGITLNETVAQLINYESFKVRSLCLLITLTNSSTFSAHSQQLWWTHEYWSKQTSSSRTACWVRW